MNTIPSRAHLGDKDLISVIVPAEIVNIEDWAYANCENLREIWIPCGCRVSNKAFVGCSSISSVHIYRNSLKADVNSYPELLGLAVRIWGSDTDLLISHASEDDRFLEYYDAKLARYLNESDDKGFKPFLAGGEEDYADENDEYERYVDQTRRNKILLIYERLCYKSPDQCLGDGEHIDTTDISHERTSTDSSYPDHINQTYIDYLRSFNPDISFCILTARNANTESYQKIYFDLGLDKDIDPEILLGMAGQDTALRAMIIEHRSSAFNDKYIL